MLKIPHQHFTVTENFQVKIKEGNNEEVAITVDHTDIICNRSLGQGTGKQENVMFHW